LDNVGELLPLPAFESSSTRHGQLELRQENIKANDGQTKKMKEKNNKVDSG
jgi:hypothetical protein